MIESKSHIAPMCCLGNVKCECEATIIIPVVCIPAVVDSLISISSLPVITMSATTSDACEDVGDVVISSKIFVCKMKRTENIKLPNENKIKKVVVCVQFFFLSLSLYFPKIKPCVVAVCAETVSFRFNSM